MPSPWVVDVLGIRQITKTETNWHGKSEPGGNVESLRGDVTKEIQWNDGYWPFRVFSKHGFRQSTRPGLLPKADHNLDKRGVVTGDLKRTPNPPV